MADNLQPGLQALQHIVVLMMENRSFDHMLGSLGLDNPKIDGVNNATGNPESLGSSGRRILRLANSLDLEILNAVRVRG